MSAREAVEQGIGEVGESAYYLDKYALFAVDVTEAETWVCGTDARSYEEVLARRVEGFTVRDTNWRTGAGIGVGSTMDELRSAYPNMETMFDDVVYSVTTSHDYDLEFSMNLDGLVDEILVWEIGGCEWEP